MSNPSWRWFLFLVLLCLIIQAFFAMLEMACVSFNKVRLQYYIGKGKKRAIWLSYLLQHPALLFGTTLIMVNTALLIGSECSRKFYDSLGISPDWAPLTQVFLVLIFAEISPMFAGRRYAEHVARLGVPLLYFCAMVLKPFIWLLDLMCSLINKLFGSPSKSGAYLSREELQNIIEEREENIFTEKTDQFDKVVSHIFTLRNKVAKELMTGIDQIIKIPSSANVSELRFLLSQKYIPYVPVFHKEHHNIIGIAYPRDLLRLSDQKKVRDHARSPWFITEKQSATQILKQFRKNNQSIAVVLDDEGHATGILTLDDIIDAVFGRVDSWVSTADIAPRAHHIILDRTFPADMELSELNDKFKVHLEFQDATNLAEVMNKALVHTPSKGDSVRIDQFELTVEDATILGIKTVSVKTVF